MKRQFDVLNFVNHPRKMMLSRLDKNRYEFSKKGCTINRIIDAMIENKLLEPMTDEEKRYLQYDECSGLFRDYRKNKSITVKCKEAIRQINIKDKKRIPITFSKPRVKYSLFHSISIKRSTLPPKLRFFLETTKKITRNLQVISK